MHTIIDGKNLIESLICRNPIMGQAVYPLMFAEAECVHSDHREAV